MALYFQIVPLLLIWVGVCRCVPKQYSVADTPQHHHSSFNKRSNEGWSEDTVSKPGGSGSRVVFPEDEVTSRPIRTRPTISHSIGKHQHPIRPKDCDGSNKFCKDEAYPESYLNDLLEKSGVEFRALFGSDYTENEASGVKDGGTLSTRIDQNDGKPLCQSQPDTMYPNKGEDAEGNTRYIVNHANFSQGIRTEKCLNVNTPCEFADTFPTGYIAKCTQKHLYRKLAALNDDNEIEWMFFPIPSCCVCTYKNRNRPGRSLTNLPMTIAKTKKSSL